MSQIQDTVFNQPPMLCLLHSGAMGCWISRKKLPSTIHTNKILAITNQTLAGNFTAIESIILKNVLLPEFHRTRRLDTLQAKIFNQTCHYDMILGRDLMNDLGIVLNWDKAIVDMREHPINASTTSFAMNLLLDAIDGSLDTNDSTFVLHQPSDLHYQANNANPDGYKLKLSQLLSTNPLTYKILWENSIIFYHNNDSSSIGCCRNFINCSVVNIRLSWAL